MSSSGAPVVAVLTASSSSGSACVSDLLKREKGPSIRAVFRSEAKAEVLRREHGEDDRLEIVCGVDAYDEGSVESALRGCDVAFIVTPEDRSRGMADDAELTKNIIRAAVRADVQHVILGSSWTVRVSKEVRTIAARFQSSEELLEELRDSHKGLKWTILRGGFFHGNYAMFVKSVQKTSDSNVDDGGGGVIRFADFHVPSNDPYDIGRVAAAVAAVGGVGHEYRTYEITGPCINSLADVADILSEVLSRPIDFINTPLNECTQGLPPFLQELFAYLCSHGDTAAPFSDDVLKVTGSSPVSLKDWIKLNRKLFEPSS